MTLNCLDCKAKGCRRTGADCFSLKSGSLKVYQNAEALKMVRSSGNLVDDGRAGTLSRFQELIEFCKMQGYERIGLAYCFGMEALALEVREKMTASGLSIIPARCSMGGILESDIAPEKKDVYSCNPAAQALFLNTRADFVVEMGLCMGHDVLFHQELKVPFTVLLVKDRVYQHNPLLGIQKYSGG